jgi:excisionase family DNA binding protein
MDVRPRDLDDCAIEASAESTDAAQPDRRSLPLLLTVSDVAALLRTSQGGIYAMIARGHLPGVVRVRRRVLVRSADLLHWLGQKSTLSPERIRR